MRIGNRLIYPKLTTSSDGSLLFSSHERHIFTWTLSRDVRACRDWCALSFKRGGLAG